MHSLDLARVAIDQSYEDFIHDLPDDLRGPARHLPLLLGLATHAGVSWSDAVAEPVLLSLPTLLLTALAPRVQPKLCASAQRAHLFAMISALIHARVDQGRIEVDAQLDALLLAIERHRHRALAELRLLGADRNASYMTAEREARSAAAAEQAVFDRRSEAKLPNYVTICCAKYSLAFPATMAAIVAADSDVEELGHVHELILGVSLGVATRDELRRERTRGERSWVAALSAIRLRTEVLIELSQLAVDAFERAASSARALAADELARWAQQQAEQMRVLLREHRQASAA